MNTLGVPMLHGVHHHKARIRTFVQEGTRVPFEDIVTSTVFGPLVFMNDHDRGIAVTELARRLGLALPEPREPELVFWAAREERNFRVRSIEPDLVISFGKFVKIVVEVKWGAQLSHHELAAQWASLSKRERKESFHVLLARDKTRYEGDIVEDRKALAMKGISGWKLKQLTWREMGEIFRQIGERKSLPRNITEWARLASFFLAQEEFRILERWDDLGMEAVPSGSWYFGAAEKDVLYRWSQLFQVNQSNWQFEVGG